MNIDEIPSAPDFKSMVSLANEKFLGNMKVMELGYKIEGIRANIVEIEAEVMREITKEVNDDGKKVYTNVESRNAALAERLEYNSSYREMKNMVEKLERERDEVKAKVWYTDDLLKIGIAFAKS
jgi:type IV secretory pathway VirD2 relaxase